MSGFQLDNLDAGNRNKKNFMFSFQTFLVSLNGIMLTFIVFSVVSTFTKKMVEEDFIAARHDIKQVISSSLNNAVNAVNSLNVAFSVLETIPDESRAREIFDNIRGHDYLYEVFIFDADQDKNADKDRIRIVNPVGFFQNAAENENEKKVIRYLRENSLNADQGHDFVKILPSPFSKSEDVLGEDQKSLLKTIDFQPYFLITSYENTSGLRTVLAAKSSVMTILDVEWLENHNFISSIHVHDEKTGETIFQYDRTGNKTDATDIETVHQTFTVEAGDRQWIFELHMNMTEQANFLMLIPNLLLFFGLLLTITGTLYVYSSQKKSYELKAINSQISIKNSELSKQIIQKEHLYKAMEKAKMENLGIINSVNDIIFETDTEGKILFLNNKWEKITGHTVDSSIGKNLFSMIYKQDQSEQRKLFQSVVDGKETNTRAFTRLRTSQGKFRSVEISISMLRTDKNNNLRVVGMFTDIEERRQAERALSEAERKYRTIVENAAGGIFQITPTGQYLSLNPSMSRILGYEKPISALQDIKNANKEIYVNPKDRNHMLNKLMQEGSLSNFETQIRNKNGDILWINENARAVKDHNDQILYFEGSIEDITIRKETEMVLKEAKLKSDLDNRSKSEFLANMSHELRTPLNSIIGFSEIIKGEVFGPVGQEAYKDYAGDIYESGKHLLKIIGDILDISRIDAGERELVESNVDIKRVTERCLKILEGKKDYEKLSVINKLGKNMPLLFGEEIAIKQMIMSLLSNAIKFTQEGGRVEIESSIDHDGQYVYSVSDTGSGMNESEIEKALQPFSQLETGHDRKNSGTGLGLTIVKSLIELHGGRLDIFSEKGIGTTATLVFPKFRISKTKKSGSRKTGSDGKTSSKKIPKCRQEEIV